MKNISTLKIDLFKKCQCKITKYFFWDPLGNAAVLLNVIFIHVEEYFLGFKRNDRIKFN